ncbi:MAG: family 78 glycoside hydrolase catalytic domain [Armatimonadetes bacterium]|nr:family 78 glycoside hydrolase catalytic domain [Armatimonadota bacterium]
MNVLALCPLVLLLSMASLAAVGSATVKVTGLTCEHESQPLAVEAEKPRLSWRTETESKNWTQSAYRVLVASSPALLKQGKGDLWDSGKVVGGQSVLVPYAGKRLEGRTACYWKVKVWGSDGKRSPWSSAAIWEMGILEPEDWNHSKWIGGSRVDSTPEPAPLLRHRFMVHKEVKRARLYASALGYGEFSINGSSVAPGAEREPGYTNFDKRVLYTAYDVTKLLRPGPNCIGAVLGTGWYDQHDKATWNFDQAKWRDRPKLRAYLVFEYANGDGEAVVSDENWLTSTGPILFDGIYTGEVYDARLQKPGWNTADFDSTGWLPATVMQAPRGELRARPCPGVVIKETFKASKVSQPKPGVYVVDLGKNIAGHVRLKVRGTAGTRITLRYSEKLDGQGMIERSQIEQFMAKRTPPQPFQTDVYICKGQGTEVWEQRFSYAGFRYVEVTGFPGMPTVDNFEGRFAHTDLESAGSFECSDEMLNKIQAATRAAYFSNAQSIPTDCPQREKNGWTGDAHLAAEAGMMNFRSASFYTKWLGDYADDQKADGRFSLIIPSAGWGQDAIHPSWDSAFHIIADDMSRYLADDQMLTANYERLKKYVDTLYGRTVDDVVPFDSLGDWVPWKTETPSQLTSSVMLINDARIVAKAALLLGLHGDQRRYGDIAERVSAATAKKYYGPSQFEKSSQTALAIGLYFRVIPEGDRSAALAALIKNVETQGHIDTGIIGAKFVLRVLSENGRTDLAYKLVTRREQPSWAWWIEQGATTLWEDWKGESSLNHIMFGDVSNWMVQWIAGIGIDAASPGFKHFFVRPQVVGGMTWAKASHLSPYGWIKSSWRVEGGAFNLHVTVPPNSTATVFLPGAHEGLAVGSGEHDFSVSGRGQ